jgi:hypothetical protein
MTYGSDLRNFAQKQDETHRTHGSPILHVHKTFIFFLPSARGRGGGGGGRAGEVKSTVSPPSPATPGTPASLSPLLLAACQPVVHLSAHIPVHLHSLLHFFNFFYIFLLLILLKVAIPLTIKLRIVSILDAHCKNGYRYSRPPPGCHLLNQITFFYSAE